MTKKTEKLLASTILVEGTSAKIIRCSARIDCDFAGLHIAAGAQYFLAQSSEDTSRYYVVTWSDRAADWQCSCGDGHKFTGHSKAVKAWVIANVVKPREREILARPVAVAPAGTPARWAGFYAQPAPAAQPAKDTVDRELDEILAEIDAAPKPVPTVAQPDIAERGQFHSARAFSLAR